MTLLKEVGTLTSPGSTGAQVVSLSNFAGETPKAILIWGTQQTADGVAVNALFCMGMATSATNRGCFGINSEDGGLNLDEDKRHDDDAVIVTLSLAGVLVERATFTSFGADAFTITWATVSASLFKYHYLVVGGSSLTDAKVVQVLSPLSTGAANYAHGMTEAPTALLSFSAANTAASGNNDGGSQAGVNVGASDMTSSVHAGAYIDQTSSARTHSSNFLEHSLVGGSIETATVTSVDDTNIALNWTAIDTREYFYILALSGVTAEVGVFTSPATAIAVTVSTSIEPEVFACWGVLMPNSAFDEADGRFCFGASDGTNQVCAGVVKNSAKEADQFSNSSSVLQVYDDTPTLLEAATVAMSGADATVTFATADSALNEFQWLALGITAEATPTPDTPALDGPPGSPGVGLISETGATKVCWGGDAAKGMCLFGSARIASTTADGGNDPTTLLRPGLVIAKVAATGYYSHYDIEARDGTNRASAILLDELSSVDLENIGTDRVFRILLAGPVRASNLIGLDSMARRQLGPRFMFDDDLRSQRHFLDLAWVDEEVTANHQIVAADAGKMLVCTDDDVELTLPTLADSEGFAVMILRAGGGELSVVSLEGSNVIAGGSITSSQIEFQTAGQLIGVRLKFEAIHVGTVQKWLLTYYEPPLGTGLGGIAFGVS
jgi:hypothetical protein